MRDRHVLVVGMARSGVAVTKLLVRHGAIVRVSDAKTEAELGAQLDDLRALDGIEWRLGEPAEALLDGIDLLVISPGVPIDSPVVLRARQEEIEVSGELEIALRLSLGKLIAITGTNGKTTTTTLVGEIMRFCGKNAHVVGNIGNPASDIAFDSRPDDVIVCEVSSFQLETVRDLHPDVCAILNISEDHLYRHGTMKNYIEHKARIFKNQTKNDTLVLNYDDQILRNLPHEIKSRVCWFSRTAIPPYGAFVSGDSIAFGSGDDFRTVCKLDEVAIRGAHNLENALAATAIAMSMDVQSAIIRHALRSFQGVEHRCERVRQMDGITFINDSKGTNVDSTLKAIESMEQETVIILGGENKNADFSELAVAMAGTPRIRHAVLLGEAAPDIKRALDAAGFGHYVEVGYDFGAAVQTARQLAGPGMNVLLSPACKSFDMFKDYEERGRVFKHIVGELVPEGK